MRAQSKLASQFLRHLYELRVYAVIRAVGLWYLAPLVLDSQNTATLWASAACLLQPEKDSRSTKARALSALEQSE